MKKLSDLFIELGQKQVNLFSENHIAYMNCIVKGKGIRNVMISVYNHLVYSNMLCPIEKLDTEAKIDIWKTSREIADKRLDAKGCMELSKVLCAIEYFLTK